MGVTLALFNSVEKTPLVIERLKIWTTIGRSASDDIIRILETPVGVSEYF